MGRRAKSYQENSVAALSRRASGKSRSVEEWSPELLKSRAYEQILLDIVLGVLPPGARLDEHGLAERYRAGLAGVRDALGRLSLEELVQRRPRSGTTVAPLDVAEIEEAYDIRRLLESHCAALAATEASDEEIARIEATYANAESVVARRDCRALITMDLGFHRAVAIASHNTTLARIVGPLNHKAARYWHYFISKSPDHDLQQDVDNHRAVARAIANRSPVCAREAMLHVFGVFSDCAREVGGGATGRDRVTA